MESLPKHPKQSEIVVYSKDVCPYCDAAKNLLTQKGVAYEEHNVGGDPARLQEMLERAKARTVPQIFIGDQHVGGFDDLKALDNKGELESLLFPSGRE